MSQLYWFLAASCAVIVAPGPDILFVLATGIGRGRLPAIIASAGFASGLSIHTTCAVFGLSALLAASATAFTVIKLAGGAYLIWLGVKAIRARGILSIPAGATPLPAWRLYTQAFVMNVLNPKVALFFLAFLPQFADPQRGRVPAQLFVLGAGFAFLSFGIFSLAGCCSGMIGGWLRARPRAALWMERSVGALFILLGLRLAAATNQ